MNIFYLSRDPYKAAVVQYNKHVVKMILESAQMLCTAHHHYAIQNDYDADIYLIKKHIIITHLLYGVGKIKTTIDGCITI